MLELSFIFQLDLGSVIVAIDGTALKKIRAWIESGKIFSAEVVLYFNQSNIWPQREYIRDRSV